MTEQPTPPYRSIVEMSSSTSLMDRVVACLATFGELSPREALASRSHIIAATPGWAEAWKFAVDNYNINQNPDTGARDDVITDEMIHDALVLMGYGKRDLAEPPVGDQPADQPG